MSKKTENKKTENPFSNLLGDIPIEPKGDENPLSTYASVGMALTSWERLDLIQCTIFGVLVNSREGSAEAAYGMASSTIARSEMLIAAAEMIINDRAELLQSITRSVKITNQLSSLRNNIAHGIVTGFTSSITDENGNTNSNSWGHFLIPPSTNTKKRISKEKRIALMAEDFFYPPHYANKYAYTSKQIDTIAEAFISHRKNTIELLLETQDYCQRKWPILNMLTSS